MWVWVCVGSGVFVDMMSVEEKVCVGVWVCVSPLPVYVYEFIHEGQMSLVSRCQGPV